MSNYCYKNMKSTSIITTNSSNLSKRHKCLPYNLVLQYILAIIIAQYPTLTLSTTSSSSEATHQFGVFMVRAPESTIAPKGDEVLFECELNIVPDRIEWRFRHVTMKENFNGFQLMNGNNITNDDATSKLRIYVSLETLGEYQCVGWFGTSAIASVTAKLTLATISLDDRYDGYYNVGQYSTERPEQTLRWKVSPKNSVLVKCGTISSNPQPVWSFYKNDIPIPPTEPQLPSGALILNSVTSKDSGIYSCSAMNSITGQEIKLRQKVELTVEHTQRTSPQFLIQPTNKVSAHPGQTVLLECPGVGNPAPKPVWSSPDVINNMSNNRTTMLPYGLQIVDVQSQDNGTYTCRLDNGLLPVLVHIVKLEVLEKPVIVNGPEASLTNETDSLELECIARGTPTPKIYWMINGVDTRTDNSISQHGNILSIRKVKKIYAGIVQCFAKNDAGEISESNLLQVNPLQIQGNGTTVWGQIPTQSSFDHMGKPGKQRKKHKIPTMIPPSRPNVTRLSDDSVMLRWYIPKNDGLEILFFKVQYRMLGDTTKKVPRGNWQTTNDDIQYGKRDKNNDKIKNFTSSASGLKPDRFYRFRIIAVYSNHDNKEGASSGKFLLQRGSTLGPHKGHLPAPALTKIEGVSENAIILYWTFPASNYIDGFYAHYRSALSAGEYTKATVDGMNTRRFKIDNLEPNTAYELKLQSFTSSAASEFSPILTGKTLKPPTPPPSVVKSENTIVQPTPNNETYYVIAGAVGGGILLLLVGIAVCFFCKLRRTGQQNDEDKPHIDHIQADGHIVSPIHKNNHRHNGVMNITPNPLAHEGDKNRNVMELRFLPTTGTTTSGHHNHQVGGSTTPSPIGTATCVGVGLSITGTSLTGQLSNSALHSNNINNSNSTSIQNTNNHHNNSNNNNNNNNINHHHHRHQPSPTPPPIPPHQHQLQQNLQQQQQQPPLPAKHHQLTNLHSQVQSSSPYHHYNQSQQTVVPQSPTMIHKQHHNMHQQNNNHHYQGGIVGMQPPMTPDHHRRTLERSNRSLHYTPSPPVYHHATMPIDNIPTRIPSLRRTRRGSGNTNGGIPGSPRIQRSPMPVRAQPAVIKRNRLGSHTENMSSGSLNSIEV